QAPLAHGGRGEADVVVDIQRARLVVGVIAVVGLAELLGVAPAQAHGEFAPGVVGVQGNEGVIEVEKGESHTKRLPAQSSSSMDLMSGMVMARCVRNA